MQFRFLRLSIALIISGCGVLRAAPTDVAHGGASSAPGAVAIPVLPPVTSHIHVDQFGYLPDEQKVAVVSDPKKGANSGDHFNVGASLELRQVADGNVVYRGPAEPFKGGKTDAISGDRGWWFDFSAVRQPGEYFVFDPKSGVRSHVVRIGPGVYRDVLRAAVRVFYYQREATAHAAPCAEAPWQEGPAFLQDREVRAIWAKKDPATARDLSGGWMDAGDTNKYPPFLSETIHPLLYAWHANPAAFTDDFNVPESGNGLPDLLDEVKWELDWLAKMQDADGGVFIKMGTVEFGASWPLSTDRHPRYYGPKCSGSTIVTAGVFAHAARVFGQFAPWRAFSVELAGRAERAWAWYTTHPRSYDCDSGEIKAGSANLNADEQDRAEAVAAMHLWALTGKPAYHEAFKKQVGAMRQLSDKVWSPYEMGAAEALLDYLALPGADPTVSARISRRLTESMNTPLFMPQDGNDELYRAWMADTCYHWGSNRIRACHGIVATAAVDYNLAGAREAQLRQRALNLLHMFHGVNPLDLVYLTNMGRCGAETSVRQLYHEWFRGEPPPGYVVGGPNKDYGGSIEWIKRQPPAKAYLDTNKGWPENSWEMSEPGIYYQACYIRLLADFVMPGTSGRS
jgi:endoglucanase